MSLPFPLFSPGVHHMLAVQIVRFMGAGGLATLLHWAVMATLVLCGAPALGASVVGAAAGALGNFALQSRWVFAVNKRVSNHSLRTYLCTVPLAWCVNAAVLATLLAHMPIWLAQLGAHASVASVNFVLYRSVVFREHAD